MQVGHCYHLKTDDLGCGICFCMIRNRYPMLLAAQGRLRGKSCGQGGPRVWSLSALPLPRSSRLVSSLCSPSPRSRPHPMGDCRPRLERGSCRAEKDHIWDIPPAAGLASGLHGPCRAARGCSAAAPARSGRISAISRKTAFSTCDAI